MKCIGLQRVRRCLILIPGTWQRNFKTSVAYLSIHSSLQLISSVWATIGPPAKRHLEWRFADGPIVACFYMFTGLFIPWREF